MSRELLLFAKAIWYGIVLLCGYDMFRVFRRVVHHLPGMVVIEDLLYWVSSGLFLFSRIYRENSGILRGYFFVGVVLGGILYHNSISRPLVRFLSFCLNKVKKVVKKVLNGILFFIKRLKFRVLRCKISLYKHFCKLSRKSKGDI